MTSACIDKNEQERTACLAATATARRRPRRFVGHAIACLAMMVNSVAPAAQLTIDRLYDDPALEGSRPLSLKISPDGSRVTLLRSRADDGLQLDLWEFNLRDNVMRRLVDSSVLTAANTLSDEEKSRRERQRTASFRGIVDYQISTDSKSLLVPAGSDLYLIELAKPTEAKRIAGDSVINPKISPKGRYISFLRKQNLFVIDLASGREKQLTFDGGGPIHNAESEFVAQEEMRQPTGYWWAPDDSAIAFKRFDESPVTIARRHEIYADRTEVVEQRYPAAGEKNVLVSLALVSPTTGEIRPVGLGAETDIYLVRADWSADARKLVFQRQSRDLKRLDLVSVDAATLAQKTLLGETSATWVNVHGDIRFLESRAAFLWASERSGWKHLYLYDLEGKLLNQISSGQWGIDSLLAVDEKAGRVYVSSSRDSVIDKQIYALALDGSMADRPARITSADGWHEATFSERGELFVDTWSDPDNPPQVSVRRPDGALVTWIESNTVTGAHPYAPYRAAHLATEFGTLPAEDGQAMHYALIKPANFDPSKRYPVLVNVYGGPAAQTVRRAWGNPFKQYLAQQGYVVFSLDNRGSGRRERRFTDVIYVSLGGHEVADQLAGIDWLARQSFVDPKRIAVFGWSYGGFMALRMLEAGSDKIAAGIAGAPVTDWALYDTYYTERFMGHPAQNAEGYKQSSVFTHLAGLKSPLLLIHGMADDNVLFTNSTRLISALTARGVLFDLMVYPGSRHGITPRYNQKHRDRLIEAFLARTLAPPLPAR